MIRFREKLFNDAFKEYQNKKQRRINNIVQNSREEVEKYKEENINTSSIFNPQIKGGFKEYQTKRIKSRNKSLNNLVSEENKTGNISNESLLKHGLHYGKKSK